MIKRQTNKTRTARSTIIVGMFLLHSLAAAGSAGELVAWGNNDYGQVYPNPAGNDFAAVAAGAEHNVALKSDGSLVAWGGMTNTPAGNNFVAVAAGYFHNVALKSDGSLVAWGPTGEYSGTPAGNDFAAISSGCKHNVALKSDGTLVAWGNDTYGQVSNTPAGNGFAAVSAGYYHNVALKSDGSLIAWGYDNYGQVSNTPAGNGFTAVSAGVWHNVALKSDGSLVAWGDDSYGQVSATPAGNDFTAVTAGYNFNVAIKADASLLAWGHDVWHKVSFCPPGNDFIAVSAGEDHGVAIRDPLTIPTYTLATSDVSPTASGSVLRSPNKSSYSYGESVQLTAYANPGYTFSYWSGDASGSSNPTTIVMDSDKSVTANFTASTSKPTVSIAATDASAGEPADNGYFTVSRIGSTSTSLRVYYSTSGSTASSGADYAALPGYVDIAAGQSSALISVVVVDDSTVEDSETVRLTISSSAAYTIGSPSSATVTIADNDQAADKPIITITAPYASAAEPSISGYFIVSRTGATSSGLRVYYSTSGSTASAGIDYAALPGYVDIASGQSWAVIYAIVMDDTIAESSETVQLTISSSAVYTIGSPSSATVTIADNDGTPVDKPIVTITAPDASAAEPADNGYFTVSRTGVTSASLRVYYSTSGSTATSGADYAALPSYVDIPAGQSSAVVSVLVIDDATVESSETVRLTISSSAAYTIGSPSYAIVTITDDDQPVLTPTVTITASDASAGEPANDGSFTVSRTGATSGSLRVYYSTSGSTAASGSDYAALPGYVDILSGQSTAVIYVLVIDDGATEGTETVRLTISSSAAYTIGSPSYATVTITDDDVYLPVPPPPVEPMMDGVVAFFDDCVADGSLVGVGKNKHFQQLSLTDFRAILVTAYQQILAGSYGQACVSLSAALSRCDGLPVPPDYVSGQATEELAWRILQVINELGCP